MDQMQWIKDVNDCLFASNKYTSFRVEKSEFGYGLSLEFDRSNVDFMSCLDRVNTCQFNSFVELLEGNIGGKTYESLEQAKKRAYEFTAFMESIDFYKLSNAPNSATLLLIIKNTYPSYSKWFGKCYKT